VTSNEHRLEAAINRGAQGRLGTYHPTNGPYSMTTACQPRTPDDDNWSCKTSVTSGFAGLVCVIVTSVTSKGDNFTWQTPDPLLSQTSNCNQLQGNLGGH
jgi:hypothetical protein